MDKKKTALIAGVSALAVLGGAGAAYTVAAQQYHQVFFPNTIINGVDASGLTVDQVKASVATGISGYTLTLEESDGKEEQISGGMIDLHPEFDGALEQLLAGQNIMGWGLHLVSGDTFTVETMTAYDADKLLAVVSGLDCMDSSQTKLPEDAYVSDYIPGSGYAIVPETTGSTPDPDRLYQAVTEAVVNLQGRLVLADADVYEKAKITSEDADLKARVDMLNRYAQMTVTYRFGAETETLNGDILHTWLTEDTSGIQISEEKAAEYVKELASRHDTAYKPKKLKTTYGPEVTISRGNYGWRINQTAETAALVQIVQSGESQEREPVYSQTAASREGNDYGNTYVEINLTAQHLYYYKDGSLVTESDFVSGNESRGMSTPVGAYPLTYKQRNATLKGQGYSTPVSYWMPFNGGVGMHDANWRGSFGGKIYKTNGSHGCINLPPSIAKVIYENITAGTPVLCYQLDGTSSEKTTAKGAGASGTGGSGTRATAAATATAPPETTAAETQPAETETAAAETQSPGPVGPGVSTGNGSSPVVSSTESGGPGATQSADTSETPGATGNTGSGTATTETPGTAGGSGTSETPGGSGTSQTPGPSGSSGTSETPGPSVTQTEAAASPEPTQTQTQETPGPAAGPGTSEQAGPGAAGSGA